MVTQNNAKNNVRLVIKDLMQNIQILYQNGEITAEQKNELCNGAKKALQTNDFGELQNLFKVMRYGSLLPDVIERCIQLTN